MRHLKAGRKLGRNASHRKAMFSNMVTSLFKHEQMETTDSKAKELRPVAEKLITLAKRGDLHARRQAFAFMRDKAVTHKLFEDLKDRFLERQGGYTRIIKKGRRKGDGAAISIIQLIPEEGEKSKSRKKSKAAKSAVTQPKRETKAVEPQKAMIEPENKINAEEATEHPPQSMIKEKDQ